MNHLKLVQAGELTMSSKEIADLVESRHDNVRVAIERLAERGIIALPATQEKATGGRPSIEYIFSGTKGKRDSLIVVAQLCPEFTARIVDRWQELEEEKAGGQQFEVPKTLSSALRLAAAQAEQIEQQQALIGQQAERIEQQRPAVLFQRAVNDSSNAQTFEEAAKELGTGRNRLYAFLRSEGMLKANNLPYQRFEESGYFRVIMTTFPERWRFPSSVYLRQSLPKGYLSNSVNVPVTARLCPDCSF